MKKYLLFLAAIFILGYVLRVMFLPSLSLTFGYDQARDAIQSLAIAHGDLKILGPSASTPGLYHGVLYYYVLAPAYLLGKGSPIAAAFWVAFINSLTILTVYAIAYAFTKKQIPSLIAALFFAVSFEATQYATWLSNPTLGIFTVPLLYLGLWKWVSKSKKSFLLWPVLAGIGLGTSIQSEIFLAYHALPVLIWLYVSRRKVTKKELGVFFISLFCSVFTMVLVEVKFGFKGIGGILSLLSTGDAIVASKGLGDFIILFFNQIGRVFSFSSYPGNVGYGFAIVILCLIFLFNKFRHSKNDTLWIVFLVTWLFSHLSVVTMGGTSTPFLLVGIGPAVSIVLGISVYYLFKDVKFVALALMFFVIWGNIKMIYTENPKGQTIFAIQKDMVLSKQIPAIDYTYNESHGGDFSINTLTSPLWINIVWTYLYDWHGKSAFGYVPTFYGRGQEGQVTALEQVSTPKPLSFLIIEPMAGIPMQYLPITLDEENSKTKLIKEQYFGEIRVQERNQIK